MEPAGECAEGDRADEMRQNLVPDLREFGQTDDCGAEEAKKAEVKNFALCRETGQGLFSGARAPHSA